MLEGKVAVVTGASGGIGRAIALAFGKAGASVAVHYNGNEAKAAAVKAEIEEAGGKAEIFRCNVADFDACNDFIKSVVKTFGKIDILVNNAGITRDGLVMGMSEEDFDAVIDTNLKGSFNCIRFASRQMMRKKIWQDHQYHVCIRRCGQCGAGKLQRFQGRPYWSYQVGGKGAGIQKYHCQRHCAGFRQDRDDGGSLRRCKRSGHETDSAGTFCGAGRYCQRGSVPGI